MYYQFITKLSEEEKKQIEIGYLDTTQHPTSGVIDTNESVMITIKIVNHSNKEVEIAFGAEGGLENNEIIVTKGIAIDHVMHGSDIILAATLDGSPLEEFPKREDNYGVKSVSCSDGAVGTFKTSNWSFIVEDFVRSETECVVDFSKDITIDETSPIITSTKEEMNQEITEGKTSIVDALAAMGITANPEDGFPVLAENIKRIASDTTGGAGDLLSGKTAYFNGKKVTGTMVNQGAKTATLNAGGSYTIPAGYHNGSGKITVNSLASQTSATATAGNILTGKTAWVNGTRITGTMANQGAKTATLNAGGSYTIPAGYHNGSGKITVNSLASQTSATANASSILTGKTAWVNGVKITGTNKGYDQGVADGKTASAASVVKKSSLSLTVSMGNTTSTSATIATTNGSKKLVAILTLPTYIASSGSSGGDYANLSVSSNVGSGKITLTGTRGWTDGWLQINADVYGVYQ